MKAELQDRYLQAPYIGREEYDESAPRYLGYCPMCLRDIYSDEDYVEQGGQVFCCEECADEYVDDETYLYTHHLEETI